MQIGTKMTGSCTVLPLMESLNHNSGKLLEDMVGIALPRKKGSRNAPLILLRSYPVGLTYARQYAGENK